jgi:metal-responsive CopG/Arc/MetJ family transcriptional regulator
MDRPNHQSIGITLRKSLWSQLTDLATESGISRNKLVMQVLKDHITKNSPTATKEQ